MTTPGQNDPDDLKLLGVCVLHPDQRAVALCAQCRSAMCQTCSAVGDPSVCPACAHHPQAFPFSRESYQLGEVLNYSIKRFEARASDMIMVAVAYFGVFFLVSMCSSIPETIAAFMAIQEKGPSADPYQAFGPWQIFSSLVQMIIQAILTLGLFSLVFDFLHRDEVEFNTLFKEFRKTFSYVGQAVVRGIIFGLIIFAGIVLIAAASGMLNESLTFGSLGDIDWNVVAAVSVIVVPISIYVGLGFMLTVPELVYNQEAGALSALRNSWRIAKGQRWPLLGVSMLSALLNFCGVLLCCMGLVISFPLSMLMLCSVYLTLRNSSELSLA